MKIEELKNVFVNFTYKLCDSWFPNNNITDVLCNSGMKSIVKAKIDNYDNYISLFTNTNGDVLVEEFLDNVIDKFNGYRIDLTEYGLPFLPKKILILSKEDLYSLKEMIKGSTN